MTQLSLIFALLAALTFSGAETTDTQTQTGCQSCACEAAPRCLTAQPPGGGEGGWPGF